MISVNATHCDYCYKSSFFYLCVRPDSRRALQLRYSPAVMQPNSSERGAHEGNGLSLNLQPEPTRPPAPGAAAASPESNEVRVNMTSKPGESGGGTSSRRSRVNSHSHTHSQPHSHNRGPHHSNPEAELDPPDSDLDSGEPSSSFSELRCLFRWLQKSLPFLVIICAKLVVQHALGEFELRQLLVTFFFFLNNCQIHYILEILY